MSQTSSGLSSIPRRTAQGGLRLTGRLAKFVAIAVAIGSAVAGLVTALALTQYAFLQGRERPRPERPLPIPIEVTDDRSPAAAVDPPRGDSHAPGGIHS